MGRINIEIQDELHRKMKSECALKGITLIDFINSAIKKELGERDEKEVP